MESKKTDGKTYHIGTKEETLISDLIDTLFDIAGWWPKKLVIKNSPKGSVKRRLADVSKIKRDTGWCAKTPLKKGLEKTLEWYRQNPKPAK
jgi:nucleoside-diphosphate-sugar epimerase